MIARFIKWLNKALLIAELLLMPVMLLTSWVVNIYHPGVRSLIDVQGIRMLTTHIVSNFAAVPFAPVILVLMCASVMHFSGIIHCFRTHPSAKQQRAIVFALSSLAVMVLFLFALLFFMPHVVLNCFGGLERSPFVIGLPGMLFVTIEVMSCVYGYTSGKLVTIDDFFLAHTRFLSILAPLFLHLFLLSQLYSWAQYSFQF